MIDTSPKYSLCDLAIVPAKVSTIRHRSEVNVYDGNEMLPIFAAPMDSVVDDTNYQQFKKNKIIPIINSATVSLEKRIVLSINGEWCGYSLDEFESVFCNPDSKVYEDDSITFLPALIDVANGNMEDIFKLSVKAKETASSKIGKNKLVLMAGNIANPETYLEYCTAGIDYVRCSIGTGSMCTTSANGSIHYPNASLIDEIFKIKQKLISEYGNSNSVWFRDNDLPTEYFTYTKIIADGGIKNYSDAIVALAVGADYVMIGGLFGGFLESCAEITTDIEHQTKLDGGLCPMQKYTELGYKTFYIFRDRPVVEEYDKLAQKHNLLKSEAFPYSELHFMVNLTKEQLCIDEVGRFIIRNCKLNKTSHGMSTKEAQRNRLKLKGITDVDNSELKTSEGKTITRPVQYTVKQWTDNFTSYLRSSMSYCDKRTLNEFKGKVYLVVKSYGTMQYVNK